VSEIVFDFSVHLIPPLGLIDYIKNKVGGLQENEKDIIFICLFSLFPSVGIISRMGKDDRFFEEFYSYHYSRKFKIDQLHYQGKTDLQAVCCLSNKFLGKALFLDGQIQSAQLDEFVYHEALVQPALFTHPQPQDVLVIGGGEGATVREVLRHSSVRRVTMVDIDRKLIDVCRKFMPEWSDGAFEDSRTELVFRDAREFLRDSPIKFDIIISDLTEPLDEGPSLYLFTKEFFSEILSSLSEDGLFVLQAGSVDPFFCRLFSSCVKTLESLFPLVRPYWTSVPSFGLPWGFVCASKKEDPLAVEQDLLLDKLKDRRVERLKFFHPGLHHALFELPLYLKEALNEGRILSDENPFIWK